jgi:hypothetical protein
VAVTESAKLLGPGRPTIYDDDLAHRIALLHAEGKTFSQIGALPDMPGTRTLWEWKAGREDFRATLVRAREDRAAGLVAEALSIIDAPLTADAKVASAEVQRANSRANYRKWMAGMLDRDGWGERPAQLQVNVQSSVVVAFGKMVGKGEGE